MGYIAPELFYKNIGGVSYKADVYSFGMLLMEMAGRRRNLDVNVANTSQLYYPSWIYDQLESEREVDIGADASEREKEIAKKMIVVALWCTQLAPGERPPMSRVVEMLKRGVERLEMPGKPFLTPQEMPEEDVVVEMSDSDESTLPLNSRTEASSQSTL